MNTSGLGGPFECKACEACKEEHYVDEPCPRCNAGNYEALMDRLAASQRREDFLLKMVERLIEETADDETSDDPPTG